MTPLLTLFLVVLMGLPLAPVQALDCHVCAYNGDNCFNPMRCPAMVAYCMTTRTYYTPTRMKVSKSLPSCLRLCAMATPSTPTTSCCQYDLCNSQPAIPPPSPWPRPPGHPLGSALKPLRQTHSRTKLSRHTAAPWHPVHPASLSTLPATSSAVPRAGTVGKKTPDPPQPPRDLTSRP
uniref:Snake toxin/toxin-like domain-containing protein n=1 Tax=Macaca fascicularis TaxID=9541 RepID=A0A7N9CJE2_MACFA